MKVFVTGATGFIGSAVVKELLAAGHEVTGLARSEEAAQKVTALGAKVHRGDITDIASLQSGAAAADGIIHTGFIHDFSRYPEMCVVDGKAIDAMGEVLMGTQRPLIVTSGTGVIVKDTVVTEEDGVENQAHPRAETERAVERLAAKGVRASVVRLPPFSHGADDTHGFLPILIRLTKDKGRAAMINGGANIWPAVHRLDAARLYRLALESNPAGGTRFHAVAEEGNAFKTVTTAIGERLQLPVVSLDAEEAAAHFTWFAHFAKINNRVSADITKTTLGWKPVHPTLSEDMAGDIYFPANQ
ncbi:SDR family oxidoreductase [Chitinophaga varians]|uniref:SDR family oxidoreductase n=1 Tax=Chitinophaga varians TaxID=2202339 RepID=UPI00165F30FC|nr:SDR family oxidoreductase [Chitinophaga varians]MBC9909454.1 SDR family oxidoreductase [Chitinophaga varians]